MIRYTVRLSGPGVHGTRVSAGLLRDLLDVLTEGTRGALRLRVEGRSAARGTVPAWLLSASDFDLVALEEGSTVLVLEGPALAETPGGALKQADLFHDVDWSTGALTLLQESLQDAIEERRDSDLVDEPLLGRFESLGRIFSKGITSLELANGRAGGPTVTVKPERIEAIRRLQRETPPPQRVRVAGQLDAIRYGDRMFTLKLANGTTLRGVAEGVDAADLAALFGKRAIVEGMAVYRPSGRILRIEADLIEAATGDVSLWSEEPRSLWSPLHEADLRKPQSPKTGLNAIIGKWPGDESDEEIIDALERLS
ncbi:MAG: hypothetical protein HY700_17275 [Gemmatimonadetes bacterium]|nr:hypothetical protein [Gemmatimonadota bacterium]